MMYKVYFMLAATKYDHSGDEWIGCYTNVVNLKEDYYKAKAALTPEKGFTDSFDIEIYEFPLNEYFEPGSIDNSPKKITNIEGFFGDLPEQIDFEAAYKNLSEEFLAFTKQANEWYRQSRETAWENECLKRQLEELKKVQGESKK